MLLLCLFNSRQFVVTTVVEIDIIVETIKEGINAAHTPTIATADAANATIVFYSMIFGIITKCCSGWSMFGQSASTRRAHRSASWVLLVRGTRGPLLQNWITDIQTVHYQCSTYEKMSKCLGQ